MMNAPICPLCDGKTLPFAVHRSKSYLQCGQCHGVMMHPDHYLSPTLEFTRYETHNNDIHDPGYRRFVAPLKDAVLRDFAPDAQGLDYGAGPGPALSTMLREEGYSMTLYDPFFWKDDAALERTYDFIVCCEVIEHFHHPKTEFQRLGHLLKPGGKLYLKTDFISEATDFAKWYYKDDATHVFFYSRDSLRWIAKNLDFSHLKMEGRVATLTRA